METREAQFRGSWYPYGADDCERQIQDFLAGWAPKAPEGVKKTGGIVPHAGWTFSGRIAARVFASLKSDPEPDLIAVFGMHLGPRHPNFIMAQGAWDTPFGPIAIASDVAGALAQGFSFEMETARLHAQDNTIELQLPFIKYFFPKARLVPIGAPPVPRTFAIGEALVEVAGHLGLSLKVIGSSDLTHYGPNYGFSPKGSGPKAVQWVKEENDRKVIEKMLALDPQGVLDEAGARQNACCSGAAATAIAAARRLGAQKAHLVEYATSHDIHPSSSFVGYAGIIF